MSDLLKSLEQYILDLVTPLIEKQIREHLRLNIRSTGNRAYIEIHWVPVPYRIGWEMDYASMIDEDYAEIEVE